MKPGMSGAFDQVVAFENAMGGKTGDVRSPDVVDVALRLRLIAEEFDELLSALGEYTPEEADFTRVSEVVEQFLADNGFLSMGPDPVEPVPATQILKIADALADISFVVIGSAVRWGIPLGPIFDEVTRANIAKAGGPVRDDGKRLKPAGWTPPDIEGCLRAAVAGLEAELRAKK